MSMYDWNGNGKKDCGDDFIEYQIYQDVTKDYPSAPRSSGGVSNIGAIVGTILTIFISAAILSPFDLDGFPLLFLFMLLCAVIGGAIAWWFDSINF